MNQFPHRNQIKMKEGTRKTFVKINEEENLIVPMCVIGTKSPFGNSINGMNGGCNGSET